MGCPTLALLLAAASASAQYVPPDESQALLDPNAKYPGECPCKDKALCELQAAPRFEKELFAFHVAGEGYNMQQWRRYDWSRLTTVALWEFLDSSAELYCYAKSKRVRVVVPASPEVAVYGGTNESAKAAWTAGVAENVRRYFADGVNMDTEDAIAPGNRTSRDGLTDMVKRVREALPEGAVVGYDVGWMPGIDGRFYDVAGIAEHADYLLIMAYDMASYIFGACLATPNSPPPQVLQGVLNYLALVDPSQLVLAVPWYGREYPCVSGTAKDARYCPIAAAPWRDANCTDAKANAVDFSSMPAKTAASVDGAHADAILEQSWMNFVDKDGNVSQLWYDDLASLEAKYRIVKDKGLRGVGVWTANMLDYGPAPSFNDSSKVPQATRDMWTSISTVPFD
ncbi:hypothetical protein AURANDRAFT_26629 [Aureococcus anophagefferens]|uniref:Uncharacterized protein I3 n=1 Tax=Aureococcus anophagefferens TaxID=44056 RepID=F0YA31_AURAN|nr:hypothetical protein AURANDRAFT_26629 [Aureococcus anophagefferens]EGB07863.1 hypothetical protein AURANDRAFT_26629 [Aureococcus anophagefferens]|eukprot:XP_009037241.1 hypothetical protein AURANDRAFT_26629 [Aureococcus anophagefferens]